MMSVYATTAMLRLCLFKLLYAAAAYVHWSHEHCPLNCNGLSKLYFNARIALYGVTQSVTA